MKRSKVTVSIILACIMFMLFSPLLAESAGSSIVSISAGREYTAALCSNGTVLSIGRNQAGQLGDGTLIDKYVPVMARYYESPGIKNLTGVKSVYAGKLFDVALMTDGSVRVWGDNIYYQLGNTSMRESNLAINMPGLSGVKSISVGDGHCAFIKQDSTIWAWGFNAYGQLGDGTTINKASPVRVKNTTGIKNVSAGGKHTLGIDTAGYVWAWGNNENGQLGDATTVNRKEPVRIMSISAVQAVSAGASHSLALRDDGTVWAWGDNRYGELGDGTNITRNMPVQVDGLSDVKSVLAGDQFSLAVKSDGTVWAWGYNGYGMLGNGKKDTAVNSVPVQVEGLNAILSATGGRTHCFAVRDDGSVWGWGDNTYAELCDGTKESRTVPVLTLLGKQVFVPTPTPTPSPTPVPTPEPTPTPTPTPTPEPQDDSMTGRLITVGLIAFSIISIGTVLLLLYKRR